MSHSTCCYCARNISAFPALRRVQNPFAYFIRRRPDVFHRVVQLLLALAWHGCTSLWLIVVFIKVAIFCLSQEVRISCSYLAQNDKGYGVGKAIGNDFFYLLLHGVAWRGVGQGERGTEWCKEARRDERKRKQAFSI